MNQSSTQSTQARRAQTSAEPWPVGLTACVIALFCVGVAARLSPIADIEGRLFWQYMTEDGYLMQTVARNLALGLGMSTAEGTIPTNGVQPLATLLFALLHAIAGGDKTEGIVLVTLVSAFIACVTAWLLVLVGQLVLADLRHGRQIAWVASALWFTAPLITRHSMNGLETGLYQAALLLSMLYYLSRFCGDGQPTWGARLLLGVGLGLTFLARNDAVFFIAALLLAHLLIDCGRAGQSTQRRFVDSLAIGSVSVLVASPWLVHNYLGFGSIVPISGTAQSHAAEFGRNLPWLPAHLFENIWLWVPVPSSLEQLLPVQILAAAMIMVALALIWLLAAKNSGGTRRFLLVTVLFTAAMSSYYGLFFGASWFLPRYLSAVSPFLWLGVVGGLCVLYPRLPWLPAKPHRMALVSTGMLVLLAVATAANDYRRGTVHMHMQVVEWTQNNVDAAIWVAAPQTGTLGYFHDRTINLDGKVNPEALRRLRSDGHSLDYLLESNAQYAVDWVGLAQWVTFDHLNPRFGQQFKVRVEDHGRNLAVLERVAGNP